MLVAGSSVVINVCIGFLIQSNRLSARMSHTLNPLPWYVLITCFSDFIIVALLSSLIISTVANYIALDIVMMNGFY